MLPLVFFLAFCDFAWAFPRIPGLSLDLNPWKRNSLNERQSDVQPTCSCAPSSPADAAFINYAPFASAAAAAPTPTGYVIAFTNQKSYPVAEGYLGYTVIETYDSNLCANLCDSLAECASFTIYYEQDVPNHQGTDIATSASVKCVFWAGSVAPIGSSSNGTYDSPFNAVIAGSNGYSNKTVAARGGFGGTSFSSNHESETSWSTSSSVGTVSAHEGAHPISSAVSPPGSSSTIIASGHVASRPGPSTSLTGSPNLSAVSASSKTTSKNILSSSSKWGWLGGLGGHSVTTTSSTPSHASTRNDLSTYTAEPQVVSTAQTSSSRSSTPPSTSDVWGKFTHPSAPPSRSAANHPSTYTATPKPVPTSSPSSSTTSMTTTSQSSPTWSMLASPVTTSTSFHGSNSHPGHPELHSIHTFPSEQTSQSSPTWSMLASPVTTSTSFHGSNSHPGHPELHSIHTFPSEHSITSTTPSSTSGSSSSSSSSTPDAPIITTTTSSAALPSETYGNFTIPQIFVNSTHLTYNLANNSVYCNWTGLWYPYSANFSLASLNLTGMGLSTGNFSHGSTNLTDPVQNSTSTSTTSTILSTSTVSSTTSSATSTETALSWTNATTNSTGYPSIFLNSTHLTYNPANNSVYCNWTGLWYPYTTNFSLSSLNFTGISTGNFSYGITNLTEPVSSTTSVTLWSTTSSITTTIPSTSADPTDSTTASPTQTSSPSYNTTSNSTAYASIFSNSTHLTYNPANNSVYCNWTGLWYPVGNFSMIPGFNASSWSNHTTSPALNASTTSSSLASTDTSAMADSTMSSTTTTSSSATPTVDSSSDYYNSTNSTLAGYPAFNISMAFNSSHLFYNAANNSIFCSITGQWYPYSANFSLASLNLTGYDYSTSNFSLPGLNFTDSQNSTSIADATVTSSTTSSSVSTTPTTSTDSDATPTATFNNTSIGNSSHVYNSTSYTGFNISTFLNSTHLFYSAANNSIYCSITNQWYPYSANFSIASLNLTGMDFGNYSIPGLNYSIPMSNVSYPITNTTDSGTTTIVSSTSTSSTSADPTATTTASSTLGSNSSSPSYDASSYGGLNMSMFMNSTHLYYSATNNSIYCSITNQWYPYSANFSLASLNLTGTGFGNYSLDGFNSTAYGTNSSLNVSNTNSSSSSPTSSAIPSGTYTFQINRLDSKRMKRSTTYIGFSGDAAVEVDSLDQAAIFQMGPGELTIGSDFMGTDDSNDYVAMAKSADEPAISQGWSLGSDGSLIFSNPAFTFDNGDAEFCIYDGSIYMVLTDEPGFVCSTITLIAIQSDPVSSTSSTAITANATSSPNSTYSGNSSYTGSYGNISTPVVFPNTSYNASYYAALFNGSSHLIFNPSNMSVYCIYTGLWYSLNDTSSIPGFNFTIPNGNYSYPLNATNATTTTSPAVASTSSTSTAGDPTITATTNETTGNSSYAGAYGNFSIPGIFPNSTDYAAIFANSSHLHYNPANMSVFCDYTGLWYPVNGTTSLAGFNFTVPPSNYSDLSTNATSFTANATSTAASSLVSTSTMADPTNPATVNNSVALNTTYSSYSGGLNMTMFLNSSHLFYSSSNNSVYCSLTGLWYPANDTSWLNSTWPASFNTTGFSFNSSLYGDSNTTTANASSTSITSTVSDTSTATATPNTDSSLNMTLTNTTSVNYTDTFPTYNGTTFSALPFNISALNASHLIWASNGSVYCEYTQQWYLPNDTSWMSFLNATYPTFNTTGLSFNSSAYASPNSTYMNATTSTDTNSTATSTTSMTSDSGAATPSPDSSANVTGVFPSYNATYSAPAFNLSALNSSHLIFAANGSVYCDYTQQWYLPNDTSWMSFLNATYPTFNTTGLSFNSSAYASPNSTYTNATTTISTTSDIGTPTPSPDSSTNTTTANSTGVFPTYNGTYSVPAFNVSAFNSSHLIFAANGSVFCTYTGLWYPANDTSWMSLLNATYPAFNASGTSFNSSGYAPNTTYANGTYPVDVNATLTSTSTSETVTPAPTADPGTNTTITNATGIYPIYNGTDSSALFNVSALNSSHLIFAPNGSVYCTYTGLWYPANDTSWMNTTYSGSFNTTGLAFNSSAFSNSSYSSPSSTYVNSTTPIDVNATTASITSTTLETPMPTADWSSNTTTTNSTGIYPSYNATSSGLFNVSTLDSSHLIFAANGSVFCTITGLWYAANDTSWMNATYPGLFNATYPGSFNASAYSFNSSAYGYNSSYTSFNSTGPVDNSTSADTNSTSTTLSSTSSTTSAMATPTDWSSNTTAANSTGIYFGYNSTISSPAFNVSSLNTTDLTFFPNGTVYCNITGLFYAANDTSWMNSTYPVSFNSTGFTFNASSYSLNSSYVNSTAPIDNSTTVDATYTSTTSATAMQTADPSSNITSTNFTGVYPVYNGTISGGFNISALNSSDLIYFPNNNTIYCIETGLFYNASDPNWNATYPASFNASSLYSNSSLSNSSYPGYSGSGSNETYASGYSYNSSTPISPAPYVAPTTATYPNVTTPLYQNTTATSSSSSTDSSPSSTPVKRWMAPRRL